MQQTRTLEMPKWQHKVTPAGPGGGGGSVHQLVAMTSPQPGWSRIEGVKLKMKLVLRYQARRLGGFCGFGRTPPTEAIEFHLAWLKQGSKVCKDNKPYAAICCIYYMLYKIA